MNKATEAILALQPVTFRYKHELDPEDSPWFGLVAEQVEKINPALVARDNQDKPYSVRYKAVTRCYSTSFSKSIAKVEEQEARMTQAGSDHHSTKVDRAATKRHGRFRRNPEKAGLANPEGERRARHGMNPSDWRT